MPKQESLFSKCCKGTTPFCLDLDDENSYVIDEPENDSNNK